MMHTATTSARSKLAPFLGLGALAASVMLGGCVVGHQTGGNGRSEDQFTYESSTYMPLSVDLVDTRNDEVFWSMDVPVGQKLVIRFYTDKAELASSTTPDLMRWELYDAKKNSSPLRNAISSPPSDVRRIDVSMRETPEYPPENDDLVGIAVVSDRPTAPYSGSPVASSGRTGTYYADRWAKARAEYQQKALDAEAKFAEVSDESGETRSGTFYSED